MIRMRAPIVFRGSTKFAILVAVASAMAICSPGQSRPPKTSWGDPDLQGMWPGTDLLGTPLQRDPKLGTRALLTDDEYAQRQARAKLVGDEAKELPAATVGSPIWWLEHGKIILYENNSMPRREGKHRLCRAASQWFGFENCRGYFQFSTNNGGKS